MSDVLKVIPEKTIIKEVIELYRDLPCLWNQKDTFYTSKHAREKAYNMLLEKYKLLDENADVHVMKKKIDNWRASFKREYRKVMDSNHCHEPLLWYYKLMTFLIDGYDEKNLGEEYMAYEDNEEEDEEAAPLEITSSPEQDASMTIELKKEYGPPTMKRAKLTSIFLTDEHLDNSSSTYNMEEKANRANESFGKTIGLQLWELSKLQKAIAEKLIAEIIFYARLEKLTAKTKMINLVDE